MKSLAIIATAFVLAAGCGNKDGAKNDDKVASCLSEAMHSCRQYSAANLAIGSDSLAGLCTTLDKAAKFSMVACPTAKLVGTCDFREGKDYFYDGYAIGVADLEKDCQGDGKKWAKQ